MGGRGFFVWGSYGVSFALIALELYFLYRTRKAVIRRLLRWRAARLEDTGEDA
jgi:heme exporter protein D